MRCRALRASHITLDAGNKFPGLAAPDASRHVRLLKNRRPRRLLRWPPRKRRGFLRIIPAFSNTHDPRTQDARADPLCLMPEKPVPTADQQSLSDRAPRLAATRRSFKLGIGVRLVLGLAAVAAVILVGHSIATETTRKAASAVRSMQSEHEPLARRAGTIVEKLVGYDRAVSEYMQAERSPDEESIALARNMLDTAMRAYFESDPKPLVTPSVTELQISVAAHVSRGQALAAEAVQRADWVARRNEALARVQQRVIDAGGRGVRIDQDQVFARRSLAELATAATSLRSGASGAASGPVEEKEFRAVLTRHSAE